MLSGWVDAPSDVKDDRDDELERRIASLAREAEDPRNDYIVERNASESLLPSEHAQQEFDTCVNVVFESSDGPINAAMNEAHACFTRCQSKTQGHICRHLRAIPQITERCRNL